MRARSANAARSANKSSYLLKTLEVVEDFRGFKFAGNIPFLKSREVEGINAGRVIAGPALECACQQKRERAKK